MMGDVKDSLNEMKGKSALVTGGTGFIGSHLVEALKNFCRVTVLSHARKIEGVTTINIDLRNEADVLKNIADLDFDIVFHLSGNVRVPSRDTAEDHLKINARGTRNLLEACKKKRVKKFILSSSMCVFGNPLYLPVDEKHPKIPTSFYGISKLLGESYCNEYQRFYGINTVILRYSHVYGPRQYIGRVCSIFINNALNKEPLQIYGSGKSSYDFVYVKDVVDANILAACEESAIGEDFNIGSGQETSIEDLAQAIREIIPEASVNHVPDRNEGLKRFVFDISKSHNVLGYKPSYTLKEGLLRQIQLPGK
jgi:UDP-glucose 4-epimerase